MQNPLNVNATARLRSAVTEEIAHFADVASLGDMLLMRDVLREHEAQRLGDASVLPGVLVVLIGEGSDAKP